MIRLIETEANLQEGLAHLKSVDPGMGEIILRCGGLPLRRREPGLEGLLSIIVSQQLSVASANAIFARTKAQFAPFEPETLHAADDNLFRACGLSGPKIRTIRSIAAALSAGDLDLDRLQHMPADEAHAAMVKVKGIGPWTADIYLMFCLGHADAFASGDLALQEALRIVYGLETRPSAKDLAAFAEPWRPWRSVAARLLWAYYKIVKTREGVV